MPTIVHRNLPRLVNEELDNSLGEDPRNGPFKNVIASKFVPELAGIIYRNCCMRGISVC